MARMLILAAAVAFLAASAHGQHGGMTGMTGVQVSPNMTDPCYTDPSQASCATFRRAHAEWTADLTSLCIAMPFMVGCHIWEECKDLLAAKNQYGNASAAFGTYCGMPSLVGNVCVEMPKMKGCEAWNALCGVNATNTAVLTCTQPGPIPDVLWTYDTKAAVDALCAGPAPVDACEDCTTVGSKNFSNNACPDPLFVLQRLCQEPENAPTSQCANFTRMCANEAVEAVIPNVCAGNATMFEMPSAGGGMAMGGMAGAPAASPSAGMAMGGMTGAMSSGASSAAASLAALAAAALAAVAMLA